MMETPVPLEILAPREPALGEVKPFVMMEMHVLPIAVIPLTDALEHL